MALVKPMRSTWDTTWGAPYTPSLPWPTPDRDEAPVCFVKQDDGLRIAHVVADDAHMQLARDMLPHMMADHAKLQGEKLGEGRLRVLRDAYETGWHIVVVEAPLRGPE